MSACVFEQVRFGRRGCFLCFCCTCSISPQALSVLDKTINSVIKPNKALSDCVSAVMSVYCHNVNVHYSHSLQTKGLCTVKVHVTVILDFFMKQIFAMLSLSAYIAFSPFLFYLKHHSCHIINNLALYTGSDCSSL